MTNAKDDAVALSGVIKSQRQARNIVLFSTMKSDSWLPGPVGELHAMSSHRRTSALNQCKCISIMPASCFVSACTLCLLLRIMHACILERSLKGVIQNMPAKFELRIVQKYHISSRYRYAKAILYTQTGRMFPFSTLMPTLSYHFH